MVDEHNPSGDGTAEDGHLKEENGEGGDTEAQDGRYVLAGEE